FHGARHLKLADRSAFLASACGGDTSLVEHVDKLLASHQLASSFLETPAVLLEDGGIESLDGHLIQGYELMAFIGAGGMGEVYKALDRKLDRPVALKLLPARLSKDPDRLRRFRAEARAVSSLNHPHILVVHDFGEYHGRPFIVTEFVDGQ